MKSIPELLVNPDVRLLGSEDQEDVEIGVPLGLQDAQKLINAARQAPFGKGEQTIVDTSFRNTWELSPNQFSLSEKWQPYVDGLMRSACDGLGVKTDDIRAELYKMLLYEKGAMFKPHADSEKVKGMFGTLVISLPSAHSGGNVVLSHNGKQHEFQTSYHEYLAWYSDVTHEVKEVTSGCRWVLTYNLVRDHLSESSPDSQIAGRKLHAILADWKQQRTEAASVAASPSERAAKDKKSGSVSSMSTEDDVPPKSSVKQAIYLLERKYTQYNLSIDSLKGADRLRAKELLSICDDYGCTLYLANLEREVMGQANEYDHRHDFSESDDDDDGEEDKDEEDTNGSQYSDDTGGSYHHIWDVCSEDITLTRVVDAEGHEVFKDIPIEEEDIVQVRPFKRKPNKNEYEGYTGNEGASATHWYKDTVIVLIPNDSFADVMMHRPKYSLEVVPAERLSMTLEYLMKRVQSTPEFRAGELRESVSRACELIATRNNSLGHYSYGGTKPTYADEIVLDAFKVCTKLGIRKPLRDLATAFQNKVPDFAIQSLQHLISEVGFAEVKPIYDNIVCKNEGVSARFKALSLLVGTDPLNIDSQAELLPEVKAWVTESLQVVFSDLGSLTEDDARELARFAVADPSGLLLKDQIAPKIYEILDTPTPTKTSFVTSFLCRLVEQSESSGSHTTEISEIYKSILEAATPGFALRKPEEPYYGYGREEPVREPVLNGHDVASIVQHCRKLGLNDCIDHLIGRILQEIGIMDTKDFPTTILPLLESLLMDIKQGEIHAESVRHLFQSSLVQWVVRHVGEEPKQHDWSREPTKCKGKDSYAYYSKPREERKDPEPCKDCEQLNKFLQDPKEKVWRFPAAEARRKHLDHELRDEHECFTTIEKPRTPFTLVVTKHKKGMDEKHRKWAARVAEVKLHLKDLEGRHRLLDTVLAEKYSDIMVVRANKLVAEVGQAGTPHKQTDKDTESHQGPRGQKRKAVVGDLTDD